MRRSGGFFGGDFSAAKKGERTAPEVFLCFQFSAYAPGPPTKPPSQRGSWKAKLWKPLVAEREATLPEREEPSGLEVRMGYSEVYSSTICISNSVCVLSINVGICTTACGARRTSRRFSPVFLSLFSGPLRDSLVDPSAVQRGDKVGRLPGQIGISSPSPPLDFRLLLTTTDSSSSSGADFFRGNSLTKVGLLSFLSLYPSLWERRDSRSCGITRVNAKEHDFPPT